MSKSLTVVLPVRNAESTLRRHVRSVLEIASELTEGFRLFIVDDASTDDTYDTAVELSARYPQIRVIRNADERGMGATLKSLRGHVAGDVVLVHDGSSPVDVNQIRRLWLEEQSDATSAGNRGATIDDLHRASATHTAMAAAHSRLLGFQKVTLSSVPDDATLTRRDSKQQSGVGVIPPLPRPNFMSSLANFALGE